MESVNCHSCDNRVLVEKYSEAHTSVQWLEESRSSCPEMALHASMGDRTWTPTCFALRDSINELADAGKLGLSERSYPVPGRLD